MPREISFIVPGRLPTKGSVKIVSRTSRRTGRTISVPINDNDSTRSWSVIAALLCRRAIAGGPMFKRPHVVLRIGMRNPQTKPDLDKVLRAVLDSLTGTAYADDRMVLSADVRKEQSTNGPYVLVSIKEQA